MKTKSFSKAYQVDKFTSIYNIKKDIFTRSSLKCFVVKVVMWNNKEIGYVGLDHSQ